MHKRRWLSLKEKHWPPLPTRGHKRAMNAHGLVGRHQNSRKRPLVGLIFSFVKKAVYYSFSPQMLSPLNFSDSPLFLSFSVRNLHPSFTFLDLFMTLFTAPACGESRPDRCLSEIKMLLSLVWISFPWNFHCGGEKAWGLCFPRKSLTWCRENI